MTTLKADDYFGEITLITNQACQATVDVTGDALAVALRAPARFYFDSRVAQRAAHEPFKRSLIWHLIFL